MAEPFAEYRGTAYLDKVDADQRKALYAWQEILRLGAGTLVDGEYFINSQIYLCRETAAYIYRDYSPTTVDYRKGSRPVLDKIVGCICLPGLSDFEKMLWLLRFIRDLPAVRAWELGADLQNGGTEEELIAKRVAVCNEQARLMAVLCQVAGLPARYIGHHIGGHGVNEVYLDGAWAYCDVQGGKFFLKADGRLASAWEVWQDPAIGRRQPDWVRREMHPRYRGPDPYLTTEHTYFHPRECTGVVNYPVADHAKFDYGRDWPMSEAENRQVEELSAERDAMRKKLRMYKGDLYTLAELREFFGLTGPGAESVALKPAKS